MNRTGLAVVVFVSATCLADTHRLPVTRDVGLCAHPSEVALNTGGNSRVRVKGNEHYYLFDFDASELGTLKVDKATLHVKLSKGHLREVAFCTVPCEWVEGTAAGKPQNGSTCFTHVIYPTHTWPMMGSTTPPHGDAAHTGGTMLDATFNSPYMRWEAADVKAGKDGWLEIPIDPELVQAVAAGLSHGLVMSEEKGQTRENHDIFTREQADARPYLTVEAEPWHITGGLKRPAPQVRALPDGRIEVDASWPMLDGKALGHTVDVLPALATLRAEGRALWQFVTLSDPRVTVKGLPPGRECEARAISFNGPQEYRSDRVKAQVPAVPEMPRLTELPQAEGGPPSGGLSNRWWWQVLGPMEKFDAVSAGPKPGEAAGQWPAMPAPVTPRNAWVSLQAVILPPGGKASGVSIELKELVDARKTRFLTFGPLTQVRLYRVWYVHKDKSPHAEVLVPLKDGEEFDLPWGANKVAGQANQAIFVDVWVPKNAGPVPYEGALAVSRAGKKVAEIPIAVEVAEATLPDEFHIVGDCNTYGSPARAMGVKPKERAAFLEMERKYYRLAHAHRMTLNVLPYSQSGQMNHVDSAPEVFFTDVPRGELPKHVGTNWEGWLDRYGPLLSGEAFSPGAGYVGPGADTPIHHMYLPFHENWPGKLAEHFRPWPPPKDYDQFLKWTADLPPIEECFDKAYAHKWHTVMQGFGACLDRMGWTDTCYQVYLNNKYYFRDRKRHAGRGISLWLLDEPMHPDDFRALAYFGRLTGEGALRVEQSGHKAKIDYRIDISRPTHQRNWLDGLVDLNVCADQLYNQRRLIDYRKRRFGEEYWNYRMPESFAGVHGHDARATHGRDAHATNVGWAVWPVRSYCWGATGTLPWQTIGSDGDLTEADATALMYPGRKFGLDEPIPSLRMKAWREGLQTAEMLRMLREKHKWMDVQLRAFVGQVCSLDGWMDGADPSPDAPIVTFKGMDAAKLELLKRAALAALAE